MRPPLLSLLMAACALAAVPPARCSARAMTGFLGKPTDQLGVPGLRAGAEVTPEGDLYTGWAEYELRFGHRLRRWYQPTRTTPDPALPLLASGLSDGPVAYRRTMFALAVDGQPVVYDTVTATNSSARPAWARVELGVAYTRGRQITGIHGVRTGAFRYERPFASAADGGYEQPGQPFSPRFSYSRLGRDLVRSGLLLARGPDAPGRALAENQSSAPTAVHDATVFSRRLAAHGSVSWTWQVPLEPPRQSAAADRALDEAPPRGARAALVSSWRRQRAGTISVSVPERRVTAAFDVALTEILCSRYQTSAGWLQVPNRLQYQAFWIRDSAIETQALDLAGLHSQATQNLAYLERFQQPDGLIISQPGQYDGIGQALWALGQHALLSEDPHYAATQLPRIAAAVGWLARATALDPRGLLPASSPRDDELTFGHLLGDDLWAAAGLRAAIATAVLARRNGLAAGWRPLDARFEQSLRRAVALAMRRSGHAPPSLDTPAGQDWGNYGLAFPAPVFSPRSAVVRSTVAWARRHMAEGLATYMNGRFLHDYLGFSIYQTELFGGKPAAAIAGLYSELAHTTASDNGWETDIAAFADRPSATNLAPHGTFAADYVALLRDLLISEQDGGVDLLAGASPAWLAPRQHVSVSDAPTAAGLVSFVERSTAGGETLSWHSSLAAGTPLRWVLPYWVHKARTADGRTVRSLVELHGRSGSLALRFSARRPRQSYARTVALLNAGYRARRLRAPIAPASG